MNKKLLLKTIILLVITAVLGVGSAYFFENKTDNRNPTTTFREAKEFVDSDFDGLPDKIETVLGTDPNNWDADADGFGDAVELKNGYSPIASEKDEKYSLEEFVAIKEKIKNQNIGFYDKFFSSASGQNGDFLIPEATLKIFYDALRNKDRDLFLKTLNKESLGILKARFVERLPFSQITQGFYLNAIIQGKYSLIEQNGRFAIMAPDQREIQNTNEKIPGSESIISQRQNIYFESENGGWKIDTEASIIDGTLRNTTKEPALKKELNTLRDYWMSGGKADTAAMP